MALYVMRHGPAEDRAPSGRDFDRALTPAGREVVDRAARALQARLGSAPARVIASPYRRARETADRVTLILGIAEAELHDDLAADAGLPLGLVREVRAAGGEVVLIGHQPTVEELVRALVHPARPSLGAGFRTATVAALDPDGDGFRLAGMIDPHAGG